VGTGIPRSVGPVLLFPTVLRLLGEYVRLLFLPLRLHTNDAMRVSTIPLDAPAFLAIVFLAATVYAFLRLGKGRPETRFGLLFLGIALIPLLNVVPLHHFRSEKALYLPSAGFCVAIAAFLDRWSARILGAERRWGLEPAEILTAVLVLVLAFGTVARNRTWKSDFTLFSDTLGKNRYAPEAAYGLGKDGYRKGAYADAVHLFRAALAPEPAFTAFVPVPWVLADAGLAYYKLKDYSNAAGAFAEAARRYPPMEEARFGLALVESARGNHPAAIGHYMDILAANPGHKDAHYNLALAYEAVDSLARAEEAYRALIDIDPRRKDAHLNLGSLLARTTRFEEALRAYQDALRLAPTDPTIHFNIGLLFAASGERRGAYEALRTTLELDSTFVAARQILEELARTDTAAPASPTPAQP
jgi:tetratricopeptide (TPR) repeat protein